MNQRASNLLDEALGLVDDRSKAWPLSGRVVLVEDGIETSAAFVHHYLVKRDLSPHSSNVVVFLALPQPFSHYDCVFRKLVATEVPKVRTINSFSLTCLCQSFQVAANGSSNFVLDFLHYCHTLTSPFGCTLVALNHEDINLGTERPALILQLEYLADILMKAEPLTTGLVKDVHGQLTILNRGMWDGQGSSRNRICNFYFRVKENGIEYFSPGSRA